MDVTTDEMSGVKAETTSDDDDVTILEDGESSRGDKSEGGDLSGSRAGVSEFTVQDAMMEAETSQGDSSQDSHPGDDRTATLYPISVDQGADQGWVWNRDAEVSHVEMSGNPEDTYHKCKFCQKRMSTKSNLLRHIREQHSVQKYVYPCGRCPSEFTRRGELRAHYSKNHPGQIFEAESAHYQVSRYMTLDETSALFPQYPPGDGLSDEVHLDQARYVSCQSDSLLSGPCVTGEIGSKTDAPFGLLLATQSNMNALRNASPDVVMQHSGSKYEFPSSGTVTNNREMASNRTDPDDSSLTILVHSDDGDDGTASSLQQIHEMVQLGRSNSSTSREDVAGKTVSQNEQCKKRQRVGDIVDKELMEPSVQHPLSSAHSAHSRGDVYQQRKHWIHSQNVSRSGMDTGRVSDQRKTCSGMLQRGKSLLRSDSMEVCEISNPILTQGGPRTESLQSSKIQHFTMSEPGKDRRGATEKCNPPTTRVVKDSTLPNETKRSTVFGSSKRHTNVHHKAKWNNLKKCNCTCNLNKNQLYKKCKHIVNLYEKRFALNKHKSSSITSQESPSTSQREDIHTETGHPSNTPNGHSPKTVTGTKGSENRPDTVTQSTQWNGGSEKAGTDGKANAAMTVTCATQTECLQPTEERQGEFRRGNARTTRRLKDGEGNMRSLSSSNDATHTLPVLLECFGPRVTEYQEHSTVEEFGQNGELIRREVTERNVKMQPQNMCKDLKTDHE